MQIKVVVVSPKYQINVGYIARVAMNFGVYRLEFVAPRCNTSGGTAIKYSKAAHGLLEKSKTRKSLHKAIDGTFSIATTGIWRKAGSASKGVYTADQMAKLLGKVRPKTLSIVLGRDDTGMRPGEIKECSAALFIQTNPEYPILNISHALAVLLYSLKREAFSGSYTEAGTRAATQADKDALSRLFKMFVYSNRGVRDKNSVALAFKSVIDGSSPTKKELRSIAAAISLKNKGKESRRKRG